MGAIEEVWRQCRRRHYRKRTTAIGNSSTQSMAANTEKIKYYYLDKRVKGESIRLAMVVGGIEFEDIRCSYEKVQEMRQDGTLPFSQVPAMQIGDGEFLHGQSQALLRWAGRRGGLYPDEHQLRIDAVTEVVAELYGEMIKVGYGSVM